MAAAKPDIVVLGSSDVPTVQAFIHAFTQQKYNPKVFIATAARPGRRVRQGGRPGNATGIIVRRLVPRG